MSIKSFFIEKAKKNRVLKVCLIGYYCAFFFISNLIKTLCGSYRKAVAWVTVVSVCITLGLSYRVNADDIALDSIDDGIQAENIIEEEIIEESVEELCNESIDTYAEIGGSDADQFITDDSNDEIVTDSVEEGETEINVALDAIVENVDITKINVDEAETEAIVSVEEINKEEKTTDEQIINETDNEKLNEQIGDDVTIEEEIFQETESLGEANGEEIIVDNEIVEVQDSILENLEEENIDEPQEELPVYYFLSEDLYAEVENAEKIDGVYVGNNALSVKIKIEEGLEFEDSLEENDEKQDDEFIIEETKIDKVYYAYYGKNDERISDIYCFEDDDFSIDFEKSFYGNIKFWGEDEYGNSTEDHEMSLWIDTEAPEISITENERVDGSKWLHIEVNEVGENYSGIARVISSVNGHEAEQKNYESLEEIGLLSDENSIRMISFDLELDKESEQMANICVFDMFNNHVDNTQTIIQDIKPMLLEMPDSISISMMPEFEIIDIEPVVVTNDSEFDVTLSISDIYLEVVRAEGLKTSDKVCALSAVAGVGKEYMVLPKITEGNNENMFKCTLPGKNSESDKNKRKIEVRFYGVVKGSERATWNAGDVKLKVSFDYSPAEQNNKSSTF